MVGGMDLYLTGVEWLNRDKIELYIYISGGSIGRSPNGKNVRPIKLGS